MSRVPQLHRSLPVVWQLLRYFAPHVAAERTLIAWSFAALVAGIALRLLEPWPLQFVFDRVLMRPDGDVAAVDATPLVLMAAAAVVVIAGARAFADYSHTTRLAIATNRILARIREIVFERVQKLSLSFHTRNRSGDLALRVIGDVNQLKDAVGTALVPLAANTLILVGMAAFMVWIDWRLALIALSGVPLFLVITARLGRRIQETAREQRRREGALAATAAESITAIRTVQALALEDRFARQFADRSRRSLHDEAKGRRLAARLERTTDLIIAVATGAVLWQGARLVLSGALSPGELLVFLTYLKRAFNPLQDLAKHSARLAKAAAAGERIMAVLRQAADVADRPGASPAPRFRGAIRLERVSFSYPESPMVLEHVDLEVAPGQFVALVGPSGIGKSTLLGLLLRLYDPLDGRVLIDGQDVRDYTLASLRAQMAVVLQDSLLFAGTVRENIAAGRSDATLEEIVAAAQVANADGFVRALPHQYETALAERGVTLSQGQRQRLALARAAVRRVPILLIDEPTANLDRESAQEVIAGIERLAQGRTTLLATHDLALAARAALVLYLDGGRLLERGTHAELLYGCPRYALAWELQQSRPLTSGARA